MISIRLYMIYRLYSVYNIYLVGGLEHFLFSMIYGIILPIDQYFSRWIKPPTIYIYIILYHIMVILCLWIASDTSGHVRPEMHLDFDTAAGSLLTLASIGWVSRKSKVSANSHGRKWFSVLE